MVPLHSRPPTEATHAMPSELFGYQVVDHLGDGAGSSIYAVSHPASGQLYALKHVVRRNDRDVRFLEQVENEYDVGRRLTHPGLRRVIDLHTQRRLFKTVEAGLVLELVDGVPLDRRLPPHLPDLITVFIRTAEALGALHRAGFVHCDFKPANILVGDELAVKLIDLGQACPLGTSKLRIQGTPDFIAPEQVKCKPVDARTDVFNLGASMYWALCGRKMPTLFTIGRGENSLLCDTIIPTPAALNPSVPTPISNLVMECVRIKVDKRPADMDELVQRLQVMHHVAERSVADASA